MFQKLLAFSRSCFFWKSVLHLQKGMLYYLHLTLWNNIHSMYKVLISVTHELDRVEWKPHYPKMTTWHSLIQSGCCILTEPRSRRCLSPEFEGKLWRSASGSNLLWINRKDRNLSVPISIDTLTWTIRLVKPQKRTPRKNLYNSYIMK